MTTKLFNFKARWLLVPLVLFTLGIGNVWGADETLTITGASSGHNAPWGTSYGSSTGSSTTSASHSISLSWTNVGRMNTGIQIKENTSNHFRSTSYPSTNNIIKSIKITMKTNTANLYGSTDGSNWTSISYTSGTAKDVEASGYKYFKVSATGSYCVLTSIVVTYTSASGYSITYHCNGATSGCPSNASSQTALPSTLPTPTRTGCTFAGWYTNEGLTSAATAGATLSANADLYAKWIANVTLNRNGATETINNVVIGTDLDDIDGTGAQGGCSAWTFVGWSKTQRAAQNVSTPMTLVTEVDGAGPYYAVYSHTEGGGGSSTVTDVISASDLAATSTSYTNFSSVSKTSDAVYAGQSSKNGSDIQLRGTNPAGIVSTTSGGTVKSVVIEWSSSATASRTVDVYGNSSAYSTAADLYNASTDGDKVGSITYTSSSNYQTTYNFSSDYEYVGIRMTSNATRIASVSITWTTSGGGTTYYSTTATCDTDPCASLQAPNVTATATANSITLSWDAVDGATSYNIYNYTTEDLDETTSLTYTFTGLSSETEYEWGVESAKDECFKETRGTTTTSATPCEKLGAATGLAVVTNYVHTDGKTYVKFSWTPADNTKDNATNQKLCFGKVDEAGTCVDDLEKNKTWTGDLKSKLEPGEYWWSIQALGDGVNYCDGDVVNGTNFTIEAPTYTVTFDAGSGTCDDESLTETSGGAGVTLPTANPSAACATDGWEFAGWWTGSVAETTTSPGELLTAGSNYKPASDCTLYAVYQRTEGVGSTSYVLTAANAVTAGTYVIGITGSSGYYIATGLTGSSDVDMAVNTTSDVTLTNNAFTTLPANGMELTFTGNNTDGFTISNSGGDKLSYSSYENRRLSFDATGKTWKVIEDNFKLVLQSHNSDGYYTISQNGTNSIRGYASDTKYNTLYLFKKTGGSTTTYNSNPTCLEPVWETNAATIDKTELTVNCGERSPMTGQNGAAIISFPTEDIYNFTKDITIEATTGFLVSTNQSMDANYQSSVSLSPLVGTTNANTFYDKHVYVRAEAPAQSNTDLEGTITIKNNKGETLQTFSVTADVTCTQYTLTLVDRGVSTEQLTKYYAGETIDEAPADPEGVCTDPIHYVFDGWAEATVDEGATYTKVSFPYTVTGNTQFYAVYRYVEDGGADSGDYVKVTSDLDDYSGDYLFVYETDNVAFDGGRDNVDYELDATNNTIEVTINGNTIESNATTDAAKFTIAKVDGGYSIKSASGYYIGWGGTKNGLNTNSSYTVNYLNTISNNTICGKTGYLMYNKAADQKRFRYFQSGQEDIALYRKAASYLYTTSPICGPHLAITEGKEIYVTGGNAGGTRDLVIAQKKVSYKATRLQTSNGLDDGTAPDVKVATNGITVGGVVTPDVTVAIDQTKEQQTDGTYTITGTITVQYQPSANNKQEDIQVQLAVDYNAEARDNFTVHARSLPAEFVIVAKSGDKWYALNGDMNTNAANPANGQVTLDDDANPTKATFAPCNTIYTFDGLPNTGDRTYVRFQGTDGAWLWASSGTNVGIQNNVLKTTPEGNNNAYNWKLYTEDNITYRFGNANSSRQLTLSGEKFGMYASGVQDIRILPYEAKCLYNYAPTNLKVSVLKGSYVTLTWDAVIGATKYQYSTNGTTWTDAGTDPTVTINGLEGNTEYTYYIRAYHEDAGVSQECIDYAEITFTTANCDDVPTDITYTADLNSITVSWTAAAPTATITYNTKEDGTGGGGTINNATSPCRISGGLNKNTTYYIQILADGTCASPIIPVKTEDVEVDIVEWYPQGIIVDINTDETVGVTLENEVSYGSGLGSLAEDLFFSKYFEGSGSLKMIAIYNGTGKDVDLSGYRIDRGSNGDATDIDKTYDLSQLGVIKQGQEIIFYSWPLSTEYSYDCSQSFLDSKVQESGLDANPRWILCDAKTHNGIKFEAMNFSGNDPLLLYKSSELIDVFGVSTEQESPASTQICSGRSDEAWSADGVTNMDYGKTTEDFPNGEIPHGVNVDDETITAYTARVIMFRKNTVVSGENAVTKNTTTFATFAEEWEARQVCMSGDDGDLTCAAYQELGTFDYSDYYTKYETMGDEKVFDQNARNADGTVTIEITDLYKHACSNIRVKLTNSNSEVLSDREYKVPIMITTDQETAYTDENKNQNAFYALQENLATVEVDNEGNPTGNKTNLTLDEVREICKTCDVVVRDNATLTKVTDGTTNDHPQVRNVYVYEGASIVIPDGVNHNYTINGLSLRRKGDVVASAQVQGAGKFVLPADEPVCLDLRVDANNWHWFTLPFDCDIADVTWVDGTPAKYNTDWFLMYYDGESRAASTNPHDNHWKVYNGTTIEAGKGYIVGITGDLTHPNYTFELRFPMAQGVLTDEQTNKTVPVNAWGVQSDNTPNNLGWNLVGNPYLNYYKTADEYSPLAGLPLIHYTYTDPVTGEWYYENSGSVPYVATPIDGGWYEYRQELASEVNMMPFTAYFVQVGDPKTHTNGQDLNASFLASNRGKKSIVRRAPREVEEIEEPIIVRVELTNSKGESDKTSLVIDDRFTNEYEMNGDFFKWFGDYYNYYTKPVLYTIGADQGKRAFNALNEELAKQPIPMGMYAAQAGNYTFSLNQQFDLSRVEEVWLYDATQSTYTNLMQSDYTFSTSKVNGAGRFSLSVKLAPKVATSIDNVTADKVWATTHTKQVIVNGLDSSMHLWLYDATGKLLYNEPTSNYQHTYSVPQTGTYFVSVMKGNAKQTIKVVVE